MGEDFVVIFLRSSMRSDLVEIREKLFAISEAEATKLYRLAWRMEKHGCNRKNIEECRNEARQLHMNAYPERILRSDIAWKYAFKS